MTREIDALLEAAAGARTRMLETTQGLSSTVAGRRPSSERWSVVDVLEHLALAEHGGIHMMWTALEANRRGEPVWQGEAPHRSEPIETVAARRMRPQEKAPPSATPSQGGPLPYWRASFESGKMLLTRLGEALLPEELDEVSYPHFLMGPLTFRQRFEFVRWHIDHHLPQVEALLASQPQDERAAEPSRKGRGST